MQTRKSRSASIALSRFMILARQHTEALGVSCSFTGIHFWRCSVSPLKDSLCRRTAISKEDSARLVLVFFFFRQILPGTSWEVVLHLGTCCFMFFQSNGMSHDIVLRTAKHYFWSSLTSVSSKQMLCISSLWHGVLLKTRERQHSVEHSVQTVWFFAKIKLSQFSDDKKKSVGIKLPQCTRPAPFVVYIVGLTFPASYFPIDGLSVCFNWKGRTWIWHKSRFSWPDCSWYFKEAIQPSLPYKHDAVKNQIFWINDCKQDALVLHLKWWRWEVINRNTCTRHNNLYFGMLQDIIRHLIKCQ